MFAFPAVTHAIGATYYVSNCDTVGSDSNNGTSTSTPWLTIAKVNSSTFQPGDSILFNKGCTWREQLTVPSSGSAGNLITFGSYGSGADPVIDGRDTTSGWTNETTGEEDFTDGSGTKPISWWMFEDASATSVDGNSTNANNLTWLASAARSTTHIEGTYSLSTPVNGDKALRIFSNLSSNFPFKGTTEEFTIGGWFNFKDTPDTFADIVDFTNFSSEGFELLTNGTVGGIRVKVFSSGGTATINSNSAVAPTGGWHHVVARWNGNNTIGAGANDEVSLWIDGVKQSTTVTRTSVALVTGSHFVVNDTGGAVLNHDELFVSDKAFLDTQIANVYNYGLAGTRNGSATNIWDATVTTQPNAVFFNGTLGTKVTSKGALTEANQWYWSSNILYVYSATNPTSIISYAQRNGVVANKNYITVQDLHVIGSNGEGITSQATSLTGVSIKNNTVEYSASHGITLGNTYGETTATSTLLVDSNTVRYNGGCGIFAIWKTLGLTISHNTVTGNGTIPVAEWGWHGISSFGNDLGGHPYGTIIEYNTVSGQKGAPLSVSYEGTGIQADNGTYNEIIRYNTVFDNEGGGVAINQANNISVYYNKIYNNGFGNDGAGITGAGGIAVNYSPGSNIYNNTIYDCHTFGIIAHGSTSTETTIKNNILYNGGIWEIQIDNTSTNVAIDNNIIYHEAAGNFMSWLGNGYSWDNWKTASGQDANSVNSDPQFIINGSNFTLQSTSPAIDTGISLGDTYKLGLNPNSVWPSSVNILDQTLNGSGWEMGAYVYSNPLSSTKAITAFNLNALSPAVVGSVNESAKTIILTVPYGTSLTNLVPTITHTGASVLPASGATQTFVDGIPTNYTVTAADASTQIYAVTVNVAAQDTYTLSITSTNGTVAKSPDQASYNSGSSVSLTATANSGYSFSSWSGDVSGSTNPLTITMDGNKSITANFTANTPTHSSSGGGSYVPKAIVAPIVITTVTPPISITLVLSRILTLKSKGEDVKALQTYLKDKGYLISVIDGIFGPQTKSAVIKFQTTNKLFPDGIVGPKTRELMTTTSTSTTNTDSKYIFSKDLKLGSDNNDTTEVYQLQKYLNSHGYQISETGLYSLGNENQFFGLLVKKALIKFQIANKLTPDGIFGPKTRDMMNK